jgi:cellulose synthase/poly-beta-1,6-N-acetylglucosamine synthase-like glycosyltransferase
VRQAVVTLLSSTDWAVLIYFLAINSSYAGLILLAARGFHQRAQTLSYAGHEDVLANPFTPSVTVIMPAFNEEAVIVQAVQAMMSLRYPRLEVMVVADGSKDNTVGVLQEAFDLVQVPKVVPSVIPTKVRAKSIYVPRSGASLVVVTKENSGRADSLNLGANIASMDLVCFVDADSILDSEALLNVVKPFVDDPDLVVATGGVVRAVNGCTIVDGRVARVRMPKGSIPRIQVVEYLRAFLLGRAGWSALQSLLIISGAFGVFRRDLLLEVGGLDASCIGEDAELVVRVHRYMREQKRKYRIVFVSEPVSWTEVPVTAKVLARQRRRWSRGLSEVLWRHRLMMLNPRYGRIGLLAFPWFFLFEWAAPLIEVVAAPIVVAGLLFNVVNFYFAFLFVAAAFGYGLVLSLASLVVEEVSFHRYPAWHDLWAAAGAAVVENFWYRQVVAFWGLQGIWAALRGQEAVWGEMTRRGFSKEEPAGTTG